MTKKSYYLFISFLFLAFISLAQPKKEYYDSEQTKLKSETNIVKGMPHGRHIEYFKNGNISRKGSFYNGKEDSTCYFFYENKTLKETKPIPNMVSQPSDDIQLIYKYIERPVKSKSTTTVSQVLPNTAFDKFIMNNSLIY